MAPSAFEDYATASLNPSLRLRSCPPMAQMRADLLTVHSICVHLRYLRINSPCFVWRKQSSQQMHNPGSA
jgi:hypothetical protein